ELPRPARRFASGVGLEQVGFSIPVQGPGPGLKGNLALLRFAGKRRARESASTLAVLDRRIRFRFGQNRAAIRLPDPLLSCGRAELDLAVWPSRSRLRRCPLWRR